MKRLIPFIVFSLMFMPSCRDKSARTEQKPSWVLSEDKMVDIITDLRITDAATYINQSSGPRDKRIDWAFVMKKHKVHDSIFRKSHDYYAGKPEISEKIYEKDIDRISEMQADYAEGK